MPLLSSILPTLLKVILSWVGNIWFFNSGKKAERLDNAESQIDAVKRQKKRDNNLDDDIRKRLRAQNDNE